MKKLVAFLLAVCLMVTTFGTWTVFAAETYWHTNWTFKGNALVSGQNVRLFSSPSKSTTFTIDANALTDKVKPEGTFDLEFRSRRIGETSAAHLLYCGDYRLAFLYDVGAVVIRAPENKLTRFPYETGDSWHTYRVVAKNAVYDLYIDDNYVGSGELQPSESAPSMTISTGTVAAIEYSNVTLHSLNGEEEEPGEEEPEVEIEIDEDNYVTNPLEVTESFFADFNTPGDTHGFSKGNWYQEFEGNNGYFKTIYESEKPKANSEYYNSIRYLNPGYGRDIYFEAKVKIPHWGSQAGINLGYPGYGSICGFKENKFWVRSHDNNGNKPTGYFSSEEVNFGDGQWHTIGVKSSKGGLSLTYYFDGKPVLTCRPLLAPERNYCHIYLYAMAGAGVDEYVEMWVDDVKMETTRYDLVLESPLEGGEYLESSAIRLNARLKRSVTEEDVPSVDYVINDQVVATASAPDYETEINDLPPGIYEVQAVSGNYKSVATTFRVVPRVKGDLLAELNGEGKMTASMNLYEGGSEKIKDVVYVLDGKVVGVADRAPYSLSVKDVAVTSHSLVAICRDENDMPREKFSQILIPQVPEEVASINYANEISYTLAGEKGTAETCLRNGNHRLYLKHTKNTLTYLTDTGEESVDVGLGDYTILTDGPYAEIYHQGQMVASMYMPRTDDVKRCISENGLLIQNYSVSVPVERQNYLVKANVTDQKAVYQLNGLPYYHVLDFVANKEDEVRLVINDEYYQGDVELKDGKFYVWNTDKDTSEPYRLEIAGALDTTEDVYYRLETAAGMCRLYGNGRWLGSFRAIRAEGEPSLAVDVKKGDLPYLAVSDYQDLYIYRDDFSGGGRLASEEYWTTDSATFDVDEGLGLLRISTENNNIGFAKINAYASHLDLSADIQVRDGADGIWLFANNDLNVFSTRAGYNFDTGEYEIVDYETDLNNQFVTDRTAVKGSFPTNQMVNMEIKVRKIENGTKKQVSLYVNGAHVLSKSDCLIQHGRFGVAVAGTVWVDKIDYRGDVRPVASYYDEFNTTSGLGQGAYFENENGVLRAFSDSGVFDFTTTAGKWQKYAEPTVNTIVARHPDGELVALVKKEPGQNEYGSYYQQFVSYISKDFGKTWTEQGPLLDARLKVAMMPGRMICTPTGRIYAPISINSNEDYGEIHIYYTDDKGKSWQRSVVIDARDLGYCMQEVAVLEVGGETRAYFRNDLGILHYFVSKDRAKTWDLENPVRTPFFMALNCYGVALDPDDSNTMYVGWSNDNTQLHGTNQYNRTNWSLAKSTDAGKTWEYIGTFLESDNPYFTFVSMNQSMYATKQYLVLDAMTRDNHTPDNGARTIVIKKEANIPTKRLHQLHMITNEQMLNTSYVNEEQMDKTLVVHSSNGKVMLRGEVVENMTTGDRISVSLAASYLGVNAETKQDGSVSFQRGMSKVTFDAEEVVNDSIAITTIAEKYGLYVHRWETVTLLSPYQVWSDGQQRALYCVMEPFATNK